MAITLRNLLLVASVLSPTFAVPAFDPVPAHAPVLQEQISNPRLSAGGSPLRRLRDSIIEKIWDVPRKSQGGDRYGKSPPTAPANFRKRYGNDIVLRFTINTEEEANAFTQAASILYLDVWDSARSWVDIRIAKEMLPSFLELLPTSLRHSHTPLMHDLAQAVYDTYPSAPDTESPWRAKHSLSQSMPHDLFFSDYQPLSVLYPWLRLLVSLFPDVAELISVGTSPEGRDIPALRIGARSEDIDPSEPRQTILLTSGGHAREWISISTNAYIAHTLLIRYGSPSYRDITKILTHYDVIFVPVLNPDGYEYTWTTDRLWRKNRQSTTLPFCPGIDLDRSFPFNWDGDSEVDNPCTESYAGTKPLEALEAKALSEWAKNYTDSGQAKFAAYLDLHSYSQQILYPYSYSCRDQPPNLEDLEEIAQGLAKNFRLTTGHHYAVDSACEGAVSISSETNSGGSTLDFFYHDLQIKYAYQIKLRDTGTYGFLLPKENIVPSGREAVEAVVGLGRWLLGNRGIESVDAGISRGEEQMGEDGNGGEEAGEPTEDTLEHETEAINDL